MRIGTRKSALAVTQTQWVAEQIRAQGLPVEIVYIESAGDKDHSKPLYEMESHGPGLFTKQLEDALLDGRIDLAVHSLKDLPTVQPPLLEVVAVSQRADVSDSILVRPEALDPNQPLGLKRGARIGTSSLRREALLMKTRPDLKLVALRGNVPTRIAKARSGELDAVILASAGLDRLKEACQGLQRTRLTEKEFVPAPGQGALALECRTDLAADQKAACAKISDVAALLETRVERTILRRLEGGCTLPLGVRCWYGGTQAHRLCAFLGDYETTGSQRQWKSFRDFEASDQNAEQLIEKTVAYFKGGGR